MSDLKTFEKIFKMVEKMEQAARKEESFGEKHRALFKLNTEVSKVASVILSDEEFVIWSGGFDKNGNVAK